MKNFQFHVAPDEREEVLAILRLSNDVLIDKVDSTIIDYTIELDDEEAEQLHLTLQEKVRAHLFSLRTVL